MRCLVLDSLGCLFWFIPANSDSGPAVGIQLPIMVEHASAFEGSSLASPGKMDQSGVSQG